MLQTAGIEVELFEAQPRLGGHAHTVAYTNNGRTQDVDLGFLFSSASSHPITTAFLAYYDVSTAETAASVASDVNDQVWSTGVANPALDGQVTKFEALMLEQHLDSDNLFWSFGQWLDTHDFSDEFYERVLLPNLMHLFLTPDGIRQSVILRHRTIVLASHSCGTATLSE